MKKILIVDDSSEKIDFIEKCIQRGPEELREIPRVTAFTKEEAMRIIKNTMDLRAGLIDCHLDQCMTLDGPEIMQFWRKIEAEQTRVRAFIALQSGSSVKSEDFKRCEEASLKAGADAAVSLVYNFDQNNEVVSPVDTLLELLAKMVPYFAKKE